MNEEKECGSTASFGDFHFPRSCPLADYDSCWSPTFNDRTLINVTACYESSILFAAREGWINSSAPKCTKLACQTRNPSSRCTKRIDKSRPNRKGWCWRFYCCDRRQSILHNSMFYQGKLQPGNLIEIMWKIASRTPSTMIPRLIYGRATSEVYKRIQFLRDVDGWWEDCTIIKMGGPGKVVEGDRMFVIG